MIAMANRRAAELSHSESAASSPASSRSASRSMLLPSPQRRCSVVLFPSPMSADNSQGSKAPSPTEQKNQTDFQFLNFSHPSDAKASRARKTVRSHVTRQQHQREHAAAAARRAKSFPPQPEEEQPAGESSSAPQPQHAASFPPPNRPELPRQSSQLSVGPDGHSQPPSPAQSPGSPDRRIDPYDVYPEAWHPYLHAIIEHYLSNLAGDIPDLDGPDSRGLLRLQFFPMCMTDLASLHAILLIAAAHYDNVRGPRSHAIDILQLRGMAIREINSALQDQVRATSDQLIAAVAKMASYEALFGDHQIFDTHMAGLQRMVSLRGGLSALGLDGLLERILLWIDSNACHITARSRLYFDSANFPSNVRHPRPDPQRFAGGLPRRSPS